jgi:hypothetical protein
LIDNQKPSQILNFKYKTSQKNSGFFNSLLDFLIYHSIFLVYHLIFSVYHSIFLVYCSIFPVFIFSKFSKFLNILNQTNQFLMNEQNQSRLILSMFVDIVIETGSSDEV